MTKNIEDRLAEIEARNKRVEEDKAWETSITRRFAIAILTYLVIVAYLFVIKNSSPFVNAVVPTVGFFLSTLVLGGVKDIWKRSRENKLKKPGEAGFDLKHRIS